MNPEEAAHKKAQASPNSAGSPTRPAGVDWPRLASCSSNEMFCRRASYAMPERSRSVRNGPGNSPLIVTLYFATCRASPAQKAVNANMLTPIMLIKATVDGMCERKFGRIVNITSGSVKSPIPNLGMSNGARAGLTGFVAGLARQVARHNVTINGLLPGPFLTDRLRSGIEFEARRQNISFEEMLAKRSATNPTGRVGDPEEFGAACAFLCAASSGFIVGQNLLLDGGAFNSTMG